MNSITLIITPAIGMIDGYVRFDVIATNCDYKDKDVFKSMKWQWDAKDKTWSTSGNAKCSAEQIVSWIDTKLSHKLKSDYAFKVKRG